MIATNAPSKNTDNQTDNMEPNMDTFESNEENAAHMETIIETIEDESSGKRYRIDLNQIASS